MVNILVVKYKNFLIIINLFMLYVCFWYEYIIVVVILFVDRLCNDVGRIDLKLINLLE